MPWLHAGGPQALAHCTCMGLAASAAPSAPAAGPTMCNAAQELQSMRCPRSFGHAPLPPKMLSMFATYALITWFGGEEVVGCRSDFNSFFKVGRGPRVTRRRPQRAARCLAGHGQPVGGGR